MVEKYLVCVAQKNTEGSCVRRCVSVSLCVCECSALGLKRPYMPQCAPHTEWAAPHKCVASRPHEPQEGLYVEAEGPEKVAQAALGRPHLPHAQLRS